MQHSGFIAIMGRPNVGKSTLMNAMVGEKVAIVSNRPQTTRNRIMGIYTEKDAQIVFLDTPGLHTPRTRLGEYMMKAAKDALQGIDALIVMVENSMILIGIPTVWKDFFVGALIVVGTGISAMQVTRANKAGLRNLKKEAVK